MSTEHYRVQEGLATLGPKAVWVLAQLDGMFLKWSAQCRAEAFLFPPLLSVRDLDAFDYFRNFPHLACAVSRIDDAELGRYAAARDVESLPREHLRASQYVLPSAACYSVYLHLRDTVQPSARYVTTIAECLRNEAHCDGLRRLWGFRMREIVCVGERHAVRAHLSQCKDRLLGYAARIGLPLEVMPASDPFYDQSGGRMLMQKLETVKEEFVYDGHLAIASVNFHRNFFGERCNIRTATGEFAYSGCVAFGMERWLHALFERFGELPEETDVFEVE